MPKKVFAVTNLKLGQGDDQYWAAGSEVDTSKFDKETLLALHDQGAIEIRTVDEEPVVTEPEEMPAEESAPAEEESAPAEETTEASEEESAPVEEAPAE